MRIKCKENKRNGDKAQEVREFKGMGLVEGVK